MKEPVTAHNSAHEKSRRNDRLIVGLGASAGGLKALKTFFENVPEKTGITYVVILHLSPDHDSRLAEVLMHSTTMNVIRVKEKTAALPDHVYVIPPDCHLIMEDDHIAISQNLSIEDRRAPVDIFFRTLAESHGPAAVCVVLSGTGANGSMGLKRIKEKGGAAFVQNPAEAEYSEMPRHSIATELADEILPVAEIPKKIIAYREGLATIIIPESAEDTAEEQRKALSEIFRQLRLRTGHDFTNYKRPTLLRRIERRMNIRNIFLLPDYALFLQTHPEECSALLKDLLISVTNFFRDKKAFDYLENDLIPNILRDKNNEHRVRIWIAGCATGEEAYSLAMLFAEKLTGLSDVPKVQLFATDIDEAAIAQAREGLYTLNDAADISPERMSHFFIKEGDKYRVRREIREMILFAHHNFLKDPPFSHLDMVSCRNVMIYLNQVAQERVLNTFHFALNPGGWLLLGSSESVDGTSDIFSSFSREYHVFQSRQASYRALPLSESVPNLRIEPVVLHNPSLPPEKRAPDRITFGDLHQRLLEEYAPPSVVVNEEYDILHLSEHAGRFFQIGGGEISQNLLKLVRQELRIELRSALYRAKQRLTPVEITGIQLVTTEPEIINLHVRPVIKDSDPARGFFLILFEKAGTGSTEERKINAEEEPIARHLEEELILIKNQLRHSIEHHEFQAEELKASNEELQATNEELRSAAEELETGKEELQSINEELRTVNQELKIKIEETTLAGNNLQNLINSVDIGTVFLDRGFRVKLFTPAARNLFNLLPADYGRPLTDITNKLQYDKLLTDAEFVLEKLQSVEREVQSKEGQSFIMRISPYRTSDDRINGVVLSFVEITARKHSEKALQESEQRFRTLTDAVPQLIWANDEKGKANYFNRRWYAYTGLNYEQSVDLGWEAIVHPDDEPASAELWKEALATGKDFDTEYRLKSESGEYRWFIGRNVPLHDEAENVTGWFGSATDIHDLKTTEEELRESEARLRATMESATSYAIITTDAAGIIKEWNPGAEEIFGYSKDDVINQSIDLIFTPEDREAGVPEKELATAIKDGKAADERWHMRRNGERFYMSGMVSPIYDDGLAGFVKVARDVTEEQYAEETLRVSEERYRVALESAGMGAWDWNVADNSISWNDQHFTLMGVLPIAGKISSDYFLGFVHPDDKPRVAAELMHAVETSFEFNCTFRIFRGQDQATRWMKGYGRVVEKKDGKTSRMVGVMYDVTDQKALDQQKEDFIGIAGHELKTPVTSVKAYADILQQMLEKTSENKAAAVAGKLNRQVERLSDLIRMVLDTTKISEGLLPLSKQLISIDELIAEKVNFLQHLSEEHQINFTGGISKNVKADPERIGQVITNLITNAINYSSKGSEINIISTEEKDGITVQVKDDGIGIDKKDQGKIFDKFFRIQKGNPLDYAGMGLGLYISAGIIQRHGGTITVDSNPGEGAAFTFTLPYNNHHRKD